MHIPDVINRKAWTQLRAPLNEFTQCSVICSTCSECESENLPCFLSLFGQFHENHGQDWQCGLAAYNMQSPQCLQCNAEENWKSDGLKLEKWWNKTEKV